MASHFIGRYEIIAELGRGGMATVFHAHDPQFKRDVAIKLMPREFLHVQDFKIRFQREAHTIASLEHDAIVPVHDIGEHEDLPYLVMRYMAGGSLADRLAREPLSLHEAIRIFNRIAPAIDFAHAQGFVHRDLKPDNILFDQHDNPFIADFGIAKLMHSTSQLTGSGALIGTPAYMSPEQIQDKGEVDHRSDLYSLGVILYESLTGQMPFVVDSSVGYFSAHLNDPVPDIRDVRPDLPPAFTPIIHRAMAKDRDDRYQSAVELAADVAHALESDAYGEEVDTPLLDSPPTRPVPYALIGGATLVVLVLVGLLLSGVLGGTDDPQQVVLQITATSQTAIAEQPSDSPTPSTEGDETTSDVFAGLNLAGKIVYEQKPYFRGTGDADIYVMNADGTNRTRLTVDSADETRPAWSPDGQYIVYVSDRDGNRELYIMNADGSDQTRLTENDAIDTEPDWSPDGTQIVFVSTRDGGVTELFVMNTDGTDVRRLTDEGVTVTRPVWSPDSSQIAYTSSQGGDPAVYIINADGTERRELTPDDLLSYTFPTWSPDGSQIALIAQTSDGSDGRVALISSTGEDVRVLDVEGGQDYRYVRWSPDGQYLVAGEGFNSIGISVIHIDSQRRQQILSSSVNTHDFFNWWAPPTAADEAEREPEPAAEEIDLRTAGWIVYSYASDLEEDAGGSGPPIKFDIYTMRADGEERTRLTVTDASDENPAWSPDGIQIAFNSDRDGNKEIYVMDADGLNQTRLTFSDGLDFGPRWSPDGSQIVFTSNRDGNREIYVMNADGSNQTRLTNSEARDHWPDWSPDGTQIVFSSSRIGGIDRLFIMNADGSDLSPPLGRPDIYADLYPRWSPDGQSIVFQQEYGMFDFDRSCVGVSATGDTLLVNLADSGAEPTLVATCFGFASWSPDGGLLVGDVWYGGNARRYNFQVFSLPDESGDPNQFFAQLTDVAFEDQFDWPDWKP